MVGYTYYLFRGMIYEVRYMKVTIYELRCLRKVVDKLTRAKTKSVLIEVELNLIDLTSLLFKLDKLYVDQLHNTNMESNNANG